MAGIARENGDYDDEYGMDDGEEMKEAEHSRERDDDDDDDDDDESRGFGGSGGPGILGSGGISGNHGVGGPSSRGFSRGDPRSTYGPNDFELAFNDFVQEQRHKEKEQSCSQRDTIAERLVNAIRSNSNVLDQLNTACYVDDVWETLACRACTGNNLRIYWRMTKNNWLKPLVMAQLELFYCNALTQEPAKCKVITQSEMTAMVASGQPLPGAAATNATAGVTPAADDSVNAAAAAGRNQTAVPVGSNADSLALQTPIGASDSSKISDKAGITPSSSMPSMPMPPFMPSMGMPGPGMGMPGMGMPGFPLGPFPPMMGMHPPMGMPAGQANPITQAPGPSETKTEEPSQDTPAVPGIAATPADTTKVASATDETRKAVSAMETGALAATEAAAAAAGEKPVVTVDDSDEESEKMESSRVAEEVRKQEHKEPEEPKEPELTEEQKAAERAKPVSSTPVPGTPWCVVWSGDGRAFFYDPSQRTSLWERPEDLVGCTDVDKMVQSPPENAAGKKKATEPEPDAKRQKQVQNGRAAALTVASRSSSVTPAPAATAVATSVDCMLNEQEESETDNAATDVAASCAPVFARRLSSGRKHTSVKLSKKQRVALQQRELRKFHKITDYFSEP